MQRQKKKVISKKYFKSFISNKKLLRRVISIQEIESISFCNMIQIKRLIQTTLKMIKAISQMINLMNNNKTKNKKKSYQSMKKKLD